VPQNVSQSDKIIDQERMARYNNGVSNENYNQQSPGIKRQKKESKPIGICLSLATSPPSEVEWETLRLDFLDDIDPDSFDGLGDGCGSFHGNELGSQYGDSTGDADESWLGSFHSFDGSEDGCGSFHGNELGSQCGDIAGDVESWLDHIDPDSFDGLGDGCGSLDGNELGSQGGDSAGDAESLLGVIPQALTENTIRMPVVSYTFVYPSYGAESGQKHDNSEASIQQHHPMHGHYPHGHAPLHYAHPNHQMMHPHHPLPQPSAWPMMNGMHQFPCYSPYPYDGCMTNEAVARREKERKAKALECQQMRNEQLLEAVRKEKENLAAAELKKAAAAKKDGVGWERILYWEERKAKALECQQMRNEQLLEAVRKKKQNLAAAEPKKAAAAKKAAPKPKKAAAAKKAAARCCNVVGGRGICIPMQCPFPAKFQGDMDKYKDSVVPVLDSLVNFPRHKNPDHQQNCVMCGNSCPATGGANPTIPRQNKGVCTLCDVTVWVVVQSGLEIKWCKGCKNFRHWASFGEKGLNTKCTQCRERQRWTSDEKTAAKKEKEERKKAAAAKKAAAKKEKEERKKAAAAKKAAAKKEKEEQKKAAAAKKKEAEFDRGLRQFERFVTLYNHGYVPYEKNTKDKDLKRLSRWMKKIRVDNDAGLLDESQKKRLLDAGFVFDPPNLSKMTQAQSDQFRAEPLYLRRFTEISGFQPMWDSPAGSIAGKTYRPDFCFIVTDFATGKKVLIIIEIDEHRRGLSSFMDALK
jgi:outer membrane biosynthesis protein TonB